MTEAMSRREIEDVLTSIKRLVSHEVPARDLSARDRAAPASPKHAAQAEKLVLTAELRVPEDEAPDMAPLQAASLDAPLAETGEDVADPAKVTPKPPRSVAPAPPSLIQRIASAGGPPVFGAGQSPVPMPPCAAPPAAATPDPAIEDAALEATLARLEAMLSAPADRPGATPDRATDPVDAYQIAAPSEQVIDETMLYQLVAQIVRQELQGELGEKITRNIRKLVRQEVARELQLRKS